MESVDSSVSLFRDKKHIYTVLELLNKQRTTNQLCDVILQICDIQIPAHACVLASASPYFDELFVEHEKPRQFCPKSPQIIEIHIDGNEDPMYITAVEKVIDFMYTSKIMLEDGVLAQVVEIARIMKMASILGLCTAFGDGNFVKDHANEIDIQVTKDGCTQTSSEQTTQSGSKHTATGETTLPRRKRGRPRKKTGPSDNSVVQQNDQSNNYEDTESTCTKEQLEDFSDEEKISDPPQVSKRGRIIKPRKYSDDIVYGLVKVKQELSNDVVKEVLKDIGESESNVDKKLADQSTNDELYSSDVKRPVKTYQCNTCIFSTTKLSEFKAHNKGHLDAEKKCSFCGWVSKNPNASNSNEEFEEHMKTHCGSEPYYCSFCPSRFSTKAKFYQHLPKHSKVRPYVCEICDASFKWKQALKNHMVTHKVSKDFLCDICGFATAHKAQLKAHHLLHTGNMFQCQHQGCGYETTKKTNLKYHMFTHTREKPHQCEVCGQSFSLVKNLRRHMLLHSTDRPFKCKLCIFSTTRYDKVKEHYYKHHNIGKKPAKKMKLTDYFNPKMESFIVSQCSDDQSQEGVVLEEEIVPASESQEVETIELTVDESVPVFEAGTQIVNISSSTGESVPIIITQNGKEVTYEITTLGEVKMIEGTDQNATMEVPQIPQFQIVSEEVLTEVS